MKKILVLNSLFILLLSSCGNYFKNDAQDNSPTSGKLNVYYDDCLLLHVKNQIATFESQYHNVYINSTSVTEKEAIEALYKDSCKAIVISRNLSQQEVKMFASKNANPRFSIVAYSGIGLITNVTSSINKITMEQIAALLTKGLTTKDSSGIELALTAVFDGNNTSTLNFLKDSIINGENFSENCNASKNTLELLNYISTNKNAIGFFNFAWLSDVDDSLYKHFISKIKFVAVGRGDGKFSEPNQSSFKTNDYPLVRPVYLYRNTGEFSLAKGFEAFVAGPKGQTTFLKQGLLPFKQQERNVQVVMEPMNIK